MLFSTTLVASFFQMFFPLPLSSFVAEEEAIEDAIWIVQEHHGMRLV